MSHIRSFLVRNDLLDPAQHGFMAHRSTCTQLLEMTQDWAMFINSKRPFHCVYFDQKSAFDRVEHRLLLTKMANLGIHNTTLNWFSSYLQKRSFRVRMDGELSTPFSATSGVPQGGCASPLLYAKLVLDINRYLPSDVKYLEYADDLKLYCTVENHNDHEKLQQAVDGVVRWCVENDMLLSTHKCVVLKYGNMDYEYEIEDAVVPTSIVTRDLGVQIRADLDFSHHVIQLVKSALILVNTIFRCFIVHDRDVYIRLYKSIVLSKLLYCSPVWEPHQKKFVKLLDSVQTRFLKRLRWRCSLNRNEIILPTISSLLSCQNDHSLAQLQRANLIQNFFNFRPNNLRNRCSVYPKSVARTEHINNMFAWRMTRLIHGNGNPPDFLVNNVID